MAEQDKVAEQEARTVTGDKGRGHYLDPAGGTMAGRLPGGYLDAQGALHREFVVREMTGAEEDLLAGKGSKMALINQVITNCLVSVGTVQDKAEIARAVQSMPTADRIAVLLTLRRVSLGDSYTLRLKCPNEDCREEDNYTIDLGTLEVHDMASPTERQYRTTFTTGRSCLWHVMTGADEEWMAATSKRRNERDAVTLSFLARIDEIGGEAVNRETRYDAAAALLKTMPVRERHELRELIVQYEGGVDTEMEFECRKCGHVWEGTMPVATAAFFFPSARRRR
jgi:rubrerythrin